MTWPTTLVAAALALCLLLPPPGHAWYRPAAGPGHYTVGRAAGLLSSFRRSPHARRPELPSQAGASVELHPSLQSLALCVKDVTPDLQSCAHLPASHGTFQCKADVFLSLSATGCPRT